MKFYYADTVTGSGKTTAAFDFAIERSALGQNFCMVLPTLKLVRQAIREAICRDPKAANRITSIITEIGVQAKVTKRIADFLTEVKADDGVILVITHEAFLRMKFWHRPDRWHVIIDETLETTFSQSFRLSEHRDILFSLVRDEPISERYSLIRPRNLQAMRNADGLKDDVCNMFDRLTAKLASPDWTIHALTDQIEDMREGKGHLVEFHGIMQPEIFGKFASCTFLAANLKFSLMYLTMQSLGVEWVEHRAVLSRVRYREHRNGHRLKILYLTETPWSKNLRDSSIEIDPRKLRFASLPSTNALTASAQRDASLSLFGVCDDQKIVVFDLFKHVIGCLFPDEKYLWIGNNDLSPDEFAGTRLPNKAHGINRFQHFHRCVVLSALNPSPVHAKFLKDMVGLSSEELRRALLSQVAYQSLGRGSLRNPDAIDDFILIVPDKITADDTAAMYPNCEVSPILEYDVIAGADEKKRGRKPIHQDDKSRKKSHEDRRKWKRQTIKAIDQLQSLPEKIPTKMPIVLKGISSGFLVSRFDSLTSSQATRVDSYSTDGLFGFFLHESESTMVKDKHENGLFSVTVFDTGCKLKDAIASMGIVIDIDDTTITPENFASEFPDLEMIIHSTWSNAPDHLRYRVCIPTTGLIPPQAYKVICQMFAHRLAKQSDGRSGLDTSKLHAASRIYLPCRRDHRFFYHFKSDGRLALDAKEWIKACPAELVPIEQPEPEAESLTPMMLNRAVNHARLSKHIDIWRQRGPIKGNGRTQFYALAKAAQSTGCYGQELRSLLWAEAAYANNPVERRSEIDGLMKT